MAVGLRCANPTYFTELNIRLRVGCRTARLAAEKPDRQIGVLHSAYVDQWSKSPHLFEIALQGFIN